MCRVSQSFYTFNTALLSCSYLVHSILAVILISGVLVLEINSQHNPQEILLSIIPLIVSIFVLILGTCCFSSTNKCLQILFFIFTTSILLCEIAIGFLLYTNHLDHRVIVDKLVRRVVSEKYVLGAEGESVPVVRLWDNIQQGLKCCGADGPLDWIENGNTFEESQVKEIGVIAGFTYQKKVFLVSQSCCSDTTTICDTKILDNTTSNMVYHEGCSDKITKLLQDNYLFGLIFISGFLLLQILIFMTSFSRACFKHEKVTKL